MPGRDDPRRMTRAGWPAPDDPRRMTGSRRFGNFAAMLRHVRILHMLCLFAVLVPLPAAGSAEPPRIHVQLEAATPAPDTVMDVPPSELRLRFTGRIEAQYTQLALTGPDGRNVPLGSIVFVEGSDREFHAAVPPLTGNGVYTVHWRTAGADGHVLQGSFPFTLAAPAATDSAATDPLATDPDPVDPAPIVAPPAVHDHGGAVAHGSTRPLQVLGRGMHFVALLLMLGGLSFRVLLLPRAALSGDVATVLRRRAWRVTAWAALVLVGAAVLRLWLQSTDLHGADRAWSTPLLSIMLTGTAWGRAWVVQAVLLGLLAAALVAVRPHRDRIALLIAVPAAAMLAAIPALSGHAAGVEGAARLVVVNDALHVIAAAAWLGTLALVLTAALPALARNGAAGREDVATLIARFSPLALGAAAIVMSTGVVNGLLHVPSIDVALGTAYGRTLLLKIALVAAVVGAGAWNWQKVRPRLEGGDDGAVRRLRAGVGFELAFAAAVLAVTALLTGLPRP